MPRGHKPRKKKVEPADKDPEPGSKGDKKPGKRTEGGKKSEDGKKAQGGKKVGGGKKVEGGKKTEDGKKAEAVGPNPGDKRKPSDRGEDGEPQGKKIKKNPPPLGDTVDKRPEKREGLEKINNTIFVYCCETYVFGQSSDGLLGFGKKTTVIEEPVRNKHLSYVTRLAAGRMHVVAINENKKLLSCGNNENGALGRRTNPNADDNSVETQHIPREISLEYFPENTVFTDVAVSDGASFVITQEGEVYGWGRLCADDRHGNSGSDIDDRWKPRLIPELSRITSIKCGAEHAIALDADGKIYSWGDDGYGQLGRKTIFKKSRTNMLPRRVLIRGTSISMIAVGDYHSFAVDEQKRVFGWGRNDYAQTGVTDPDYILVCPPSVERPTLVQSLVGKQIVDIDGGLGFSVVAFTQLHEKSLQRRYLSWGKFGAGQLGIRERDLSAASGVVRDASGEVISHVTQPFPYPPNEPFRWSNLGQEPTYKLSAAFESVMSKNGNEDLYSWGGGEEFHNGQKTSNQVSTPTKLSIFLGNFNHYYLAVQGSRSGFVIIGEGYYEEPL